jgi:post-segregation antitoxin (ccd killing protein)
MARVNVYLPDDLAARARDAGLNVSALTRAALEAELAGGAASEWLTRAARLPASGVEHNRVIAALEEARQELAGEERG